MSYARFGLDGSDVYVFGAQDGLECCGCILQERRHRFSRATSRRQWMDYPVGELIKHRALTTDEMLVHLQQHRDAGHCVPEDVVGLLEAERAENDAAVRA